MGRGKRLYQLRALGAHGRGGRQLLSADVIKVYEKEETIPSLVGDVYYRKEDHQCVRPVIIVKGKLQKDMKGKEDYYDIVEIVPGKGLMQKPDAFGCQLGDYT